MTQALRPRRRGRAATHSVVALAVALLAGVTAACTPTQTPSGPTPQEQFCEFWEKVEEAPPTEDSAVLVKDEVVALAEDTAVTGSECTAANAKVALDGATLAEGEEVPSEIGGTSDEKIAAVTGEEIAAGEPVLENVSLQALSAEIGTFGIRVRGNVAVRLSGVTSTIAFTGTLTNLENWSVTLSSAALSVPGITTSPATFTGTLTVRSGVPSLAMTASATSAKIGDVTINSATVRLNASPTTGLAASVQGSFKVGPSTASGTMNVEFDRTGTLVSAHADIAAHLVGTQAGGKKVDLQGTLKLDGNATETVASFTGSGIVGDLVINEANGQLTLQTNKATFLGKLDVAQGANSVRFNGSIVWDGNVASVPFMTLEGAGEISGTLADGQEVSVNGTISAEIIGGQVRTVVTGAFKVGTLKANGSAVLATNGSTTSLEVDAALVGAGFSGTLAGAVIITDGRAETVQLDATVNGPLNLGDVTLTGASLSIDSSAGNPLALSFSGGLKIGTRADLTGSVEAQFGPNGTLISLGGNMQGTLQLDSWAFVPFSGSIVATQERVTLSGSGAIVMTNFPLGIHFSGSFSSSLTQPSWSLQGSGRFRLGSIDVASARLSLSQGAGMKATRVGFYFSIIGIPTYFEGDFYMKPEGGCREVYITSGSFLARPILGLVLPGVIGCPVHT